MVKEHEETGLVIADSTPGGEIVNVDQSTWLNAQRVEIDRQVATAKQYPRNVKTAVEEAESLATATEDIASQMFYALPRAGKVIEGPNVRLCEVFFQTWGNLQVKTAGVTVLEKEVVASFGIWDMQRNISVMSEARRRITRKNGDRFDDDMVLVTAKAAASIAFRDAIKRVVPLVYIDRVYKKCRAIAAGDAKSIGTRRAAAFQAFAAWGVTKEQVLARLQVASEEEITADHLATLVGIRAAIKDGQASVEQAFPPLKVEDVKAAPQMQAIVNELQKATARPAPAQEPPEEPDAATVTEGPTDPREDLGGRGPDPTPPMYNEDDREAMYEKVCQMMADVGAKKMDKLLKDAGIDSLNEKTPAAKLATVLDKLGAKVK
jgi:hypothetical protein